jgi:hypothetical protein
VAEQQIAGEFFASKRNVYSIHKTEWLARQGFSHRRGIALGIGLNHDFGRIGKNMRKQGGLQLFIRQRTPLLRSSFAFVRKLYKPSGYRPGECSAVRRIRIPNAIPLSATA